MKFFIVTCIKEYQETVQQIFKEAHISAFSSTDIVGFKGSNNINIMEEWFASGDEEFDSCMLFSFTTDENANNALDLIVQYNKNNKNNFPFRAFVVPVEKASY